MEKWTTFELDCYNYLINKYGHIAVFDHFGKSDSTISDIQVTLGNGSVFFIEVKNKESQAGQFVLIPNGENNIFTYSDNNKTVMNDITRVIIDYMDSSFDSFVTAGTKGKRIYLAEQIFYRWVIDYYSKKNVRYFITKGDTFIIFPIENMVYYFDVGCSYRQKKSGSTNPANKNLDEIKSLLKDNGLQGQLKFLGKELFFESKVHIKDKTILKGLNYSYIIRSTVNNNYRIRRLSNTSNSNVIFDLRLSRRTQRLQDLIAFENTIYLKDQ